MGKKRSKKVLSKAPSETNNLLDLIGHIGKKTDAIEVKISMDIIRLFSEGLYQSPHKAIEELVTNSYDAGAFNVHILIPQLDKPRSSLWVVDDGCGMDKDGLQLLWQVAQSPKEIKDTPLYRGRAPIGQFGIGKLASYVLAWQLTHISKVKDGTFRYVSMDFHKVKGRQWEPQKPLFLDLRIINESEAKKLLAEVNKRDPIAWQMMFGNEPAESWTAAALSDFRDLADKLKGGTLGWVLSTGLPLVSDFKIYLNGQLLKPSKVSLVPIDTLKIGTPQDEAALKLKDMGVEIKSEEGGIYIPGIGLVTGEASIYREQLTTGKSSQSGRSHGFFIKVRGRVINLNDELFGLDALNHAAWSRFTMVVNADGLRDYLQSSREGVRYSPAIELLQGYLHLKFNECRQIYEKQMERDFIGIDLERLLEEVPSSLIRIPLVDTVRSQLMDTGNETYYIKTPIFDNEEDKEKWLKALDANFDTGILTAVGYESHGPYAKLAEYDPKARKLIVNEEHPFVVQMSRGNSDNGPVTLFAQAEVLLEVLMRDYGLEPRTAFNLMLARDRALRSLTGGGPVIAREAMRLLDIANQEETAMERAIGYAFEAMGFVYTKRERPGGQDGIADAKLGLRGDEFASYLVVFDAKTTSAESVAANAIPFSRINQFKADENADFAIVVAKAFNGQDNPDSSANRSAKDEKISLITADDLKKLLEIHLRHGITLIRLRELFQDRFTVIETHKWVEDLESELAQPSRQIPVLELLKTLEILKKDKGAPPTVYAARERSDKLNSFNARDIYAVLEAISTIVGRGWINVKTDGSVFLDQSPEQIVAEVNRAFKEDLNL
ncbi:MAG: ATP-binding protein [Dehalococcoidia bacterium]|nr:ATP-binding protein [Dehalococcoidia bacterium]